MKRDLLLEKTSDTLLRQLSLLAKDERYELKEYKWLMTANY